MATEPAQARDSKPPVTAGYEPRDVNAPWIFGIVIFLMCCGMVIQAVLAGAMKELLRSSPPTDPWVQIRRADQPLPPGHFPRLQISPRVELRQFRAIEDMDLTNYGWVNRTAGIVRVPIERA